RRPLAKNPQDFGAGILITAIGIAALWIGEDYTAGTLVEMGPGWAPKALSWILVVLGLCMIFQALRKSGPDIEKIHLRAQAPVLGSILTFALTIETLGLAPATFITCLVACLANRSMHWIKALVLGVCVAAASSLIFVVLLGQP